MSTTPVVAHTDKYDLRIYEQNGKYVVAHSVNNGNLGAGISTFDTAEEANQYLQSVGADESVFFDAEDSGLPGGAYSNAVGDATKFMTKYSVLNMLTGGKYSDLMGELAEKGARYTLPNAIENVDKLPGSAYTEAMGNGARVLTQYSLLNLLTNGEYSEKVGQAAENVSKFSLINVISNLFS